MPSQPYVDEIAKSYFLIQERFEEVFHCVWRSVPVWCLTVKCKKMTKLRDIDYISFLLLTVRHHIGTKMPNKIKCHLPPTFASNVRGYHKIKHFACHRDFFMHEIPRIKHTQNIRQSFHAKRNLCDKQNVLFYATPPYVVF